MSKRVVIVASGETERRALPHLVQHLQQQGIKVVDIRIPGRHRALTVQMAERLIKAAWFASVGSDLPDKFVVLLDADGKDVENVLNPFRSQLPQRIPQSIKASLQFACAQWHLEAWYFADSSGLRTCLGRDLGQADASQPDSIADPKRHLKNLLGSRVYTAVVSEEIARHVAPETIAQRSPSFAGFLDAVRNGA
jgi:hypothetical protein